MSLEMPGRQRVAYRPLRNAPRLIPLISAIGVSFFLQDFIRLVESIWRNAFNLVYPTIDALNYRFELSESVDIPVKSLVVTVSALGMLWGLHALVNRTKMGAAIRAVAEDQTAASLMGINVNRIISLTFLIGGGLAGAAGLLNGLFVNTAWWLMGVQAGLRSFTAAVLGGIGNVTGAMLGGFLIGILTSLSDGLFDPAWTRAWVFTVLTVAAGFARSAPVRGSGAGS